MAIPAFTTVLTSMFLHGSWMHLIGNMLYLWVFGNNIEDVMGSTKFVVFYLLCGIVAAFSHALTDPTSTVPMVGASGAISGVLRRLFAAVSPCQNPAACPAGRNDLCAGRHRAGILVRDADPERGSESRIARRRSCLLRAHRRVCRGYGADRLLQTTGGAVLHPCPHLLMALASHSPHHTSNNSRIFPARSCCR